MITIIIIIITIEGRYIITALEGRKNTVRTHIRASVDSIRINEYREVIPVGATVVPLLMNRIRADPEAVPIFLERHIECADRLSTGKICIINLHNSLKGI